MINRQELPIQVTDQKCLALCDLFQQHFHCPTTPPNHILIPIKCSLHSVHHCSLHLHSAFVRSDNLQFDSLHSAIHLHQTCTMKSNYSSTPKRDRYRVYPVHHPNYQMSMIVFLSQTMNVLHTSPCYQYATLLF